jgi:hypothetical protein
MDEIAMSRVTQRLFNMGLSREREMVGFGLWLLAKSSKSGAYWGNISDSMEYPDNTTDLHVVEMRRCRRLFVQRLVQVLFTSGGVCCLFANVIR